MIAQSIVKSTVVLIRGAHRIQRVTRSVVFTLVFECLCSTYHAVVAAVKAAGFNVDTLTVGNLAVQALHLAHLKVKGGLVAGFEGGACRLKKGGALVFEFVKDILRHFSFLHIELLPS